MTQSHVEPAAPDWCFDANDAGATPRDTCTTAVPPSAPAARSVESRLRELGRLRDQGLVTAEEQGPPARHPRHALKRGA